MPYMIYQQYKTAVADGYKDRSAVEIRRQAGEAHKCRGWVESLEISSDVRDVLVEQIHAIEEALEEMLRAVDRTEV
jgi:hypothetical protein